MIHIVDVPKRCAICELDLVDAAPLRAEVARLQAENELLREALERVLELRAGDSIYLRKRRRDDKRRIGLLEEAIERLVDEREARLAAV